MLHLFKQTNFSCVEFHPLAQWTVQVKTTKGSLWDYIKKISDNEDVYV